MKRYFIFSLLVWFWISIYAQDLENLITVEPGGKQTIYRQAGNYSEEHDVVTIAVKRGSAYQKEYDKFLAVLDHKLDSLNLPHVIFQEFPDDKPGTIFMYFIENSANGPFRADELIAILPHLSRRYRDEYPHLVK